MTITNDQIAARFVTALRCYLTADEWQAMCAANRAETHAGICHSHDFCDANMLMLEAFVECGLTVSPDDGARWSAVWEAAMPALR